MVGGWLSSGQDQDSGSHVSRGDTCPQVAGLEPDSPCIVASGTGLPFLGVKDGKAPPAPGLPTGARPWQCRAQTPGEVPAAHQCWD